MNLKQTARTSTAQTNELAMNYRYMGAWNEVNSRIAQRQNAVTIYVTLSSVIVTVLLANARSDAPLDPNLFSLLIPVVSIVFGLLNYKHDTTIALLRLFMQECEKDHLQAHSGPSLPCYNSSLFYRKHADDARRFHDYSCLALIGIFNLLGVVVAHKAFPNMFSFTGWPIFIYGCLFIASSCFVMKSTWWPHKFEEEKGKFDMTKDFQN